MLGAWIAAGGALGAVARFLIGGWVTTWASAGFPWPTFAVNVAGSALLGVLYAALTGDDADPRLRAALGPGFCGGFTTFSTFDFETFSMLQHGEFVTAALYSSGSITLCIAGVLLGHRAGRRVLAR